MRGHESLIAMRMRGHVPARGVVIDAGRSYYGDAGHWDQIGWPRAFVEVADADRIGRLDLSWVVGLRAVLVRQPFYPLPVFADLTRLVLGHQPQVLSCAVMPDEFQDGLAVHHWRAGAWSKGWAPEELESLRQGWPTLEDLC